MGELADKQQQIREQHRLIQQANIIENSIHHHANVAIDYYSQGKAVIRLATFIGILAALSGFLISQKGWEKTNNFVICFFITFSSLAVLYSQFPSVLRLNDNFQANRQASLAYMNSQNQLHSFVATEGIIGQDPDKPHAFSNIDTNRFIHYIDNQLADLASFHIGYDASKTAAIKSFDFSSAIPTRMHP